ncbi:hypothetical protein B0H34DRAFT_689570 [Crassisporium funariophilum]|nr:hypothetical protein B0H34DRAFT_689570 [Crassisporium funariophilum]
MSLMEQNAGDTFQTIGPSNEVSDSPSDDARLLIDQEIARLEDAIRQEIARLEDAIRALKFRRNKLSPISCLPPELLSRIFSFIENQDPILNGYEWIQFSQVSSHWRLVALNSPTLWTNIPLAGPLRVEEMLRRSKMANLTVKGTFRNRHNNFFPRKLLGLMHHVEEIDIASATWPMQYWISELPQEAPQLHTLRIRCIRLSSDYHISFVIPDNVLSETPQLRRLELEGGGFDWDSRVLSGLTHLTLRNAPIDTRPSTTQFLNALQRMPALKYLDYDDSFSHTSSDATSSTISVDLVHLQFLRLSSRESHVSNILQRVTFPSSIQLKLSCKVVEGAELSVLPSLLSRKYFGVEASGENCFCVRSLAISYCERSLKFEAWAEGTEGNFSQLRQARPRFELTLLRAGKKPSARNIYQHVCGAIPLHLLSMLHLETHDFISVETLATTLGELPQVRWMHVSGPTTTRHILEALSLERLEHQEILSAYHQVFFPALQALLLEGVEFGHATSFNQLQDCLIDRCERQVALQSLILKRCFSDLDERKLDLLREIVVDVIWDGVYQSPKLGWSVCLDSGRATRA